MGFAKKLLNLLGRDYANIDEVKEGDILLCDDNFDCLESSQEHKVYSDRKGNLFVTCNEGHHYLSGQLAFHPTEEDGSLIGFYFKPMDDERIIEVLNA